MNGRSGTLSIDNFGGVGGGIHALPQGTALIARDIGPAERNHNKGIIIHVVTQN